MTGEIPPSFLHYSSRRQSHRFFTVLEKPISKEFTREERTHEISEDFFLLLALSKPPGVSLAVLWGQPAILSWLLISVTPSQLGVLMRHTCCGHCTDCAEETPLQVSVLFNTELAAGAH